MVNQSGDVLVEIVSSVKRVTDIVGEIAAASREQATGVEQVGKAMSQMDQVTQQNAAQTEELSSTAQNLAATADQLQGLVGRFKLENQRNGRPEAARALPPARAGAGRIAPGSRAFGHGLRNLSHKVGPPAERPAASEDPHLPAPPAGVPVGTESGFEAF
jgi:ABC-type transporter Mla subunit MlaD